MAALFTNGKSTSEFHRLRQTSVGQPFISLYHAFCMCRGCTGKLLTKVLNYIHLICKASLSYCKSNRIQSELLQISCGVFYAVTNLRARGAIPRIVYAYSC